jgi:SpoVK/Ycf46/Vps4 family AAA+-type ATPase
MFELRENIEATKVTKKSFEKALQKVRPSASKEIQDAYRELQDKFTSAQGKKFADEKPSYYG